MTLNEIEVLKARADSLVASYGALKLSTNFQEAVEQLNKIWSLDPIDLQIALPAKSIAFSNTLSKATSFLGGSGKKAANGAISAEVIAIAKTKGTAADKAAGAL